MFVEFNPNPKSYHTDDHAIRSVAKVLNMKWEQAYKELAEHGMRLGEMMHKSSVWGDLLAEHGFARYSISNNCPNCYTVSDFAMDHPLGTYVLGTGDYSVAVIDGDWFDTWDSGDEVPIFYYE